MEQRELLHILAAIIILTAIVSFTPILEQEYRLLPQLFVFSGIIVLTSILAKKLMAHHLDSTITHELFTFQRFGFRPKFKFKKSIPAGIIFPLFFSIFSLGFLKVMTLLTYEAKALKRRAAKRHGYYSYTEMTEFHYGLIGASGISTLLLLSLITYFLPFQGLEVLSKLSTYYAFWNLIPFSKLDGTQIFFGSRIVYYTLAIITIIFTAYALFVV